MCTRVPPCAAQTGGWEAGTEGRTQAGPPSWKLPARPASGKTLARPRWSTGSAHGGDRYPGSPPGSRGASEQGCCPGRKAERSPRTSGSGPGSWNKPGAGGGAAPRPAAQSHPPTHPPLRWERQRPPRETRAHAGVCTALEPTRGEFSPGGRCPPLSKETVGRAFV